MVAFDFYCMDMLCYTEESHSCRFGITWGHWSKLWQHFHFCVNNGWENFNVKTLKLSKLKFQTVPQEGFIWLETLGQIDYFFTTLCFCHFWNFTASFLIHFHSMELSSMNTLPKLSFCVLLKNESPTDLERHEREYLITENFTMPERQVLTDYKQRHLSWDPGHVSTAQNRKSHSDQLSIYKIRLSLRESLSSGSPLGCSTAQEAQRVRRQQANFSIQCF